VNAFGARENLAETLSAKPFQTDSEPRGGAQRSSCRSLVQPFRSQQVTRGSDCLSFRHLDGFPGGQIDNVPRRHLSVVNSDVHAASVRGGNYTVDRKRQFGRIKLDVLALCLSDEVQQSRSSYSLSLLAPP
jgi:hypothetical protein